MGQDVGFSGCEMGVLGKEVSAGGIRRPEPDKGLRKLRGWRAAAHPIVTMSAKTGRSMATRERSILKGDIAGMIGGLAGAGAKMLAEKIFPPRSEGQTAPPVALVEQVAGHPLADGQR